MDTGLNYPQHKGRIYAFLKGALDAGISVPHGETDLFPEEKKIEGQHVQEYGEKIKGNKDVYERQFAQYLKSNSAPENMAAAFMQVKQKSRVKQKMNENVPEPVELSEMEEIKKEIETVPAPESSWKPKTALGRKLKTGPLTT